MSPDRSTPVALEIGRGSELWNGFAEAEAVVASAVAAAFAEASLSARPDAELSVALSDDAAVQALNARWRAKDAPTNVLTFPAFEADEMADAPMLGDIVLAFETIAREAEADGKPFAAHVAHLTVHGVLHLFGYDHLDDDEAEVMEAIETRALVRLGLPDPYADGVELTETAR